MLAAIPTGIAASFGQNQLVPLLGELFGQTLGGFQTGSENSRTGSYFDQSSIPLFNQQVQQANVAGDRQRQYLESLFGDRNNALQQNLNRQTQAMQGYGNHEISDINRSYNSRQGNVGQSLANRGLYNSTIAPGMSALVERERNSALGGARNRQQQVMGSLFGNQAALMDQANAQRASLLANQGNANYQLQTLLPQAIASNRVTDKQTQTTAGSGLFGKLFA